MEIEMRPARPDDADVAIPLIYSSGPPTFDYVFNHKTRLNAQGYLRRSVQVAGGEFGYGNRFVAVLDGQVVGSCAGFSGKSATSYLITALRQILGWYGPFQGAGVIRRGLQVESIVKPPKSDEYCVAHVGVDPDSRSRGIGEQMIHFLLERARAEGFRVSVLDVSVDNPRAQSLYERLGYTVTREYKSNYQNETSAVADHRRMELPL